MPDERSWDVFLSYASPDQAEVEKLALRLEDEAHLKVFLDKWRVVPGEGRTELHLSDRVRVACRRGSGLRL